MGFVYPRRKINSDFCNCPTAIVSTRGLSRTNAWPVNSLRTHRDNRHTPVHRQTVQRLPVTLPHNLALSSPLITVDRLHYPVGISPPRKITVIRQCACGYRMTRQNCRQQLVDDMSKTVAWSVKLKEGIRENVIQVPQVTRTLNRFVKFVREVSRKMG